MRVLLVDDNEAVLELVSLGIEGHGHTVVKTRNGFEAKELILKEEAFDAIITDNNMPVMTGVELLLWFRTEFERIPCTKLIIWTGIWSETLEELGQKFPDVHVLAKNGTVTMARLDGLLVA